MELKILENSKNKVVIDIEGLDIGLINLIRKELWNDDKIKVAGFHQDHPQDSNIQLIVETSSQRKAIEAIHDAIKRIKKNVNKVSKDLSNSMK